MLKLSKALTIQFMFGMPVHLQNGHFKFIHQGQWSRSQEQYEISSCHFLVRWMLGSLSARAVTASPF